MPLHDLSPADLYDFIKKSQDITEAAEKISTSYKFELTGDELDRYLSVFNLSYKDIKNPFFNPALDVLWDFSLNQLRDLSNPERSNLNSSTEQLNIEFTQNNEQQAIPNYTTIYNEFKSVLSRNKKEMIKDKWNAYSEIEKNYLLGKMIKISETDSDHLDTDMQKELLDRVIKTDFVSFINEFVNLLTNKEVLLDAHDKLCKLKTDRLRSVFPNLVNRINQLKYIEENYVNSPNVLHSSMLFTQLMHQKNIFFDSIKKDVGKKELTQQLIGLWDNGSIELRAYLTGKPIQFADHTIEGLTRDEQKEILLKFKKAKLPKFLKVILKEVTDQSLLQEFQDAVGDEKPLEASISHKVTAKLDKTIQTNKFKNQTGLDTYIEFLISILEKNSNRESNKIIKSLDHNIFNYLIGGTIFLEDGIIARCPEEQKQAFLVALLLSDFSAFTKTYLKNMLDMDLLMIAKSLLGEKNKKELEPIIEKRIDELAEQALNASVNFYQSHLRSVSIFQSEPLTTSTGSLEQNPQQDRLTTGATDQDQRLFSGKKRKSLPASNNVTPSDDTAKKRKKK